MLTLVNEGNIEQIKQQAGKNELQKMVQEDFSQMEKEKENALRKAAQNRSSADLVLARVKRERKSDKSFHYHCLTLEELNATKVPSYLESMHFDCQETLMNMLADMILNKYRDYTSIYTFHAVLMVTERGTVIEEFEAYLFS